MFIAHVINTATHAAIFTWVGVHVARLMGVPI